MGLTWSGQMAGQSIPWLLLCVCEAMAGCDKTCVGDSCDTDRPTSFIVSIPMVTWLLRGHLLLNKCPCLC